ncbi:hypothetical protein HI914_02510 [Erysiphe necator]|nr:hypothetical protein HI914_02510 [Erysiphe necator]
MSTYKSPPPSNLDDLCGSDEVYKLLNILKEDLTNNHLSTYQRETYLDKLKILGRDPSNSSPLYTNDGIKILASYAFTSHSPTTSRNASKCLANAMLLRAETRQMFVNLGLEDKICEKLKIDNSEDEFLMTRIIFLTTYASNIKPEKLIDQNNLADNICLNIRRHTKRFLSQSEQSCTDPFEEMALNENLKLIFNLTHFFPMRKVAFHIVLKDLVLLLNGLPVSENSPLEPPTSLVINAILNLDFEKTDSSILFPTSSPDVLINHCVKILDLSLKNYGEEDLEQNVTPLILLFQKLNDLAPQVIQAQLQQLLLPSLEDRQQILGRAESTPSRLLRLLSNPMTPKLRESVSNLLFELSGKDAGKLIHNIGYGFASGFICNHDIPVPENLLETSDISQGHSDENLVNEINPVTGQLLEEEEKINIKDMTDEEKEREAEKLFVLFERLKKNGVISVKNPMELYQNSGKFEELKDDLDPD